MITQDAISSTREAMERYRVSFSVDCVIFGYGDDNLKILLVECNLPPFIGKWSLLGDFIRDDEDLDNAARRVLEHYTGLGHVYLEQVGTYGDQGRHPLGRVITTAYYSLMMIQNYRSQASTNGLTVRWFDVNDLPELAFDHSCIIRNCHARLQQSLRERPIGFELLPKEFTLSQLRRLYETVLGIELDKRNFRRKLRSLDLLEDTEMLQSDVAHRPAKLFRFNYEKYKAEMSEGLHFEL